MAGFLERDIYKSKRDKASKRDLCLEYMNDQVQLYVRNAGRLDGKIKDLVGKKLILHVKDGKKPILVDIDDISILNPLD